MLARQATNEPFEVWLANVPANSSSKMNSCSAIFGSVMCYVSAAQGAVQSMSDGAFEVKQIGYDSTGTALFTATGSTKLSLAYIQS